METVVLLIMLLVVLGFALKLTFMPSGVAVAECLLSAAVTVFLTDAAAEQSKTQIQEWLASPELMLDTAVILTVDVAIQLAFCITAAGAVGSLADRIRHKALLLVPGLLLFPVLFACLVQLIFAFPGTDFRTVAYALGGAVLIAFPLLALGLRYLMPEWNQRLELTFYVNCIIAMLGVVATVNGRTATAGVNEVNLPALAATAGLALVAAATGMLIYKRKLNKLI